jgi:hypothetical protein
MIESVIVLLGAGAVGFVYGAWRAAVVLLLDTDADDLEKIRAAVRRHGPRRFREETR